MVGGHRRVGERDVSFKPLRLTVALDSSEKEQEQRWHRQLDKLWNRDSIDKPRNREGVHRQANDEKGTKSGTDYTCTRTSTTDHVLLVEGTRRRLAKGRREGIGMKLILVINLSFAAAAALRLLLLSSFDYNNHDFRRETHL